MSKIVMLAHAAQRRLDAMFPGYFTTAKHNHYADFGYPVTLDFPTLYGMYTRNGLATAGVNKTVQKTWETAPFLLEKERDGSQQGTAKETKLERDIRKRFDDLRLWSRLADADKRSMVGKFAAVILRFADGKSFSEPVDRVAGGLDGLVELIPAWEGQIEISAWETDEKSEDYGRPKMFQFNEAAVGNQKQPRQLLIHPDRVIVWSADGTVNGSSALEPGFNDLLTLEKISGAGGEGFWKNAKSAPVLEVDKEAKIAEMAKAMGVQPSEVADKMDEQVADWQKGFDQLLMLQGMTAKTLSITLPSPEHFFAIALQSFAASLSIPLKILVGSQTGERASTEDADEWSKTNMSRRSSQTIPNIMALINRLERVGILPERDWHLDWADLTEASMPEKIDRAFKMADANTKLQPSGEWLFTPDEIRAVVDLEPLSDSEKMIDDATEEETSGAIGDPTAEEMPL